MCTNINKKRNISPSRMSIRPFIISFGQPRRLVDEDLALTPEELLSAVVAPLLSRDYYRPWRQMSAVRDAGSTIKCDRHRFQVNLDVQHFTPEEISVKTVDGFIIIEGKHEEKKDDHGLVSRNFTRKYAIPEGCNPELVESKLSSDGILTVIAPRVVQPPKNVRSVPIAQTGPVRKEIKDQTSQDKEGEK